jgi:hypothetical protein
MKKYFNVFTTSSQSIFEQNIKHMMLIFLVLRIDPKRELQYSLNTFHNNPMYNENNYGGNL